MNSLFFMYKLYIFRIKMTDVDELEYWQKKIVYRTGRKLFRNAYRLAVYHKDNDALTREQFNDLAGALRLGGITLEYLSYLRKEDRFNKKLAAERAVLRRRMDRLREIIYDPDKPDSLEEKIDVNSAS